CRQFELSELSPSVREVINHSIWLASVHSANLLFFAALALSKEALQQVRTGNPAEGPRTTEDLVQKLLAELVGQAARQGVTARASLAQGQGTPEIIEQVKTGGHDLVVVGTREQTWLSRVLFGSTALGLLHSCPCPVWVTKPGEGGWPRNILIATDLKAA